MLLLWQRDTDVNCTGGYVNRPKNVAGAFSGLGNPNTTLGGGVELCMAAMRPGGRICTWGSPQPALHLFPPCPLLSKTLGITLSNSKPSNPEPSAIAGQRGISGYIPVWLTVRHLCRAHQVFVWVPHISHIPSPQCPTIPYDLRNQSPYDGC